MDITQTEQPLTEARAALSDLTNAVRLDPARLYFLTSRGTRRAALISADLGALIEQAGGPAEAEKILREHSQP